MTSADLDALPQWADAVPEPFRQDPSFWRSLFASADAALLLVAAAAAAWLLGRAGLAPGWALLPFVLPAAFAVQAVVTGRRSSRASRVWFRQHDGDWRDSERQAVAAVFLHAVVRNRFRRAWR
jgi:hypothetical protein